MPGKYLTPGSACSSSGTRLASVTAARPRGGWLRSALGVVMFEPDGDRASAFAAEFGERAVAVAGDHNSDEDVQA